MINLVLKGFRNDEVSRKGIASHWETLFFAVLLLGVKSIRGRAPELWASWAESTNDFPRAHSTFILHVCANNPFRFRSHLCRVCV
jgi:hypothetical protein